MNKSHKEEVSKYFSKTAGYWKNVYDERRDKNKFTSYWMKQRAALVMECVGAYAGARSLTVLDVGCGPGVLLEELARHGHDTVGIDINPSMIQAVREISRRQTQGRISCLLSDCEGLPFRDDHFDLIACVGVLQYLEKDAGCLKELSRVSKPDGRIIVTLPNLHSLHTLLDPYYIFKRGPQYLRSKLRAKGEAASGHDPFMKFGLNVSFLNRHYHWGQLRPIFKQCGLKEISAVAVAFSPPTFWRKALLPDRLSRRVSARLGELSRVPGFRWLTALADRWVICLEKRDAGKKP